MSFEHMHKESRPKLQKGVIITVKLNLLDKKFFIYS